MIITKLPDFSEENTQAMQNIIATFDEWGESL